MVTAAQRRRAVDHLTSRRVSQRRACRLAHFRRSAAWYRPRGRDDQALRQRLRALAERYPRYGDPTLHALLVAERRKRFQRPRTPWAVPTRPNERCSLDFVSDQLANGRRFRVLNVVDDFSRECVLQVVDLSISGQRLARELDYLGDRLPRTIVCDNGLPAKSRAGVAQSSSVRLATASP